MRLAIISDIHGNFQALQEVLKDIASNNVDEIICLGDIITLGAQPREVLETFKNLNCVFIRGNHESALFDMARASHYKIAPAVIEVLEWCKSKLTSDDMEFLASFKDAYELNLNSHSHLHCFHGSPLSNTDLITSTTTDDSLENYFSKNSASHFAGGHSHLQMLRQFKGKLILNPGSVGMPFLKIPTVTESPKILPWAEYAIIDYDEESISVNLIRKEYDVLELFKIIEKSDIPLKEWWRDQFKGQ